MSSSVKARVRFARCRECGIIATPQYTKGQRRRFRRRCPREKCMKYSMELGYARTGAKSIFKSKMTKVYVECYFPAKSSATFIYFSSSANGWRRVSEQTHDYVVYPLTITRGSMKVVDGKTKETRSVDVRDDSSTAALYVSVGLEFRLEKGDFRLSWKRKFIDNSSELTLFDLRIFLDRPHRLYLWRKKDEAAPEVDASEGEDEQSDAGATDPSDAEEEQEFAEDAPEDQEFEDEFEGEECEEYDDNSTENLNLRRGHFKNLAPECKKASSKVSVAVVVAAEDEKEELQYDLDEGVVILTDANFDAFLKQNPSTLVKFYAPWCGHCKHLAPEYEKASSKVSIPLAKVDATVETELGKRFEIQGYPTLKFWKDGQGPTDYDGGRDEQGIVEWVHMQVDPNYKPPAEEVVTLTVETFDDFVANHSLVLIEFYAPWYGHFKKLAPEYEKAAQKLKAQGANIKLAKVDATVEKKLGEKYGVSGFPTMNGKRFKYLRPREAAGYVKYMLEQAKPSVQKLKTLKEVTKFMDENDVTIVGFFASEDSSSFDAFSDSSEIFREHSANLVGKMTRANAATRYSKFPLVIVYYNADFMIQYRDGSELWRQEALAVANKYQKDKYRFAVVDEEEFSEELAEMGLGDSGLEHNVLVFGYDGKKYPMNPDEFDGELDENLEAFIKKISSGKAKTFVKSQPVTRDDKGPLKSFVPKYKELAAKLKKTQPNLVHATANQKKGEL